jgi:hypothetical protein
VSVLPCDPFCEAVVAILGFTEMRELHEHSDYLIDPYMVVHLPNMATYLVHRSEPFPRTAVYIRNTRNTPGDDSNFIIFTIDAFIYEPMGC